MARAPLYPGPIGLQAFQDLVLERFEFLGADEPVVEPAGEFRQLATDSTGGWTPVDEPDENHG